MDARAAGMTHIFDDALVGQPAAELQRAAQQASQLTEQDYGTPVDDMFIEQGSDIPATRFIACRTAPSKSPALPPQCWTIFHADYDPLGAIPRQSV